MNRFVEKVLFDPQDHELLRIVNEVLSRDKAWKHFKNYLCPIYTLMGLRKWRRQKLHGLPMP